jgi:Flp pilus assembly protein TadG
MMRKTMLQRLGNLFRAARKDESGVSAIIMALSSTVLVGFCGLAIDVSQAYFMVAKMQNAADAAALAAIRELGNASEVDTVADEYALLNLASKADPDSPDALFHSEQGVWNADTRVFTATDLSPTAVRVRAERTEAGGNPMPTIFATLFGFDHFDLDVDAVAAKQGNAPCFIALEETEKESVYLNSNGDVDLTDCSAYIESDGETPALHTNSGGDIEVGADQTICAHSYDGGGYNLTPTTNCSPLGNSDPLDGVGLPALGACTGANTDLTFNVNTTISPGTYCKKLMINATKTLTLQPGVYVLRGVDFNINANSTLKQIAGGDGVFIYFTYHASYGHSRLTVNANSTMNLAAKSTGPYAGVLMYSASNNGAGQDQMFNSHGVGMLKGTVYFPTSRIVTNSHGVVNASCGSWIGNNYYINSQSNFNMTMGDSESCGFDLALSSGGGDYALVD